MVTIKQGDYGTELGFVITDQSGNFLDLTNGSPCFKMRLTPGSNALKINSGCTIDNAISGACHYTLGSGDTSVPGTFEWEIETVYGGSIITTRRTENIVIEDSLP